MRMAVIGLAAALALTGTAALAQNSTAGVNREPGFGSSPSEVTTGSASTSLGNTGIGNTSLGNTGLGAGAGSIAAGTNSTGNPSGNSFINTSPSGSTLIPSGRGAR